MKAKRISKSVKCSAIILLAILTLCMGCSSIQINSKHYTSGRILLLPPRDVVQNGTPHPKGVGSGSIFQDRLKSSFAGSVFNVVTTGNKKFNNTEIADKDMAVEEAKSMNADYYLQIVLGEFQNAAPMTFRPDYVHLDDAIMYDVKTGETVWALTKPIYLEKSNLGNHLGLLSDHAQIISKSIIKNMK
ncbi:MAG: hypothetical protein KAI40_12810 [Desulfobacterales bacterium]|nr:hypothetical protein [Desulfobacterales bacterium]